MTPQMAQIYLSLIFILLKYLNMFKEYRIEYIFLNIRIFNGIKIIYKNIFLDIYIYLKGIAGWLYH